MHHLMCTADENVRRQIPLSTDLISGDLAHVLCVENCGWLAAGTRAPSKEPFDCDQPASSGLVRGTISNAAANILASLSLKAACRDARYANQGLLKSPAEVALSFA
jgi:hypothetical protein